MKRFRALAKHRQLALLSLVCPVLAVAIAVAYFTFTPSNEYVNSVNANANNDADRHAAVLMAFSEAISAMVVTGVSLFAGSLIGAVLASLSLKERKQFGGMSLFALVINLSPLVLLLLVLIGKAIWL